MAIRVYVATIRDDAEWLAHPAFAAVSSARALDLATKWVRDQMRDPQTLADYDEVIWSTIDLHVSVRATRDPDDCDATYVTCDLRS